jgi:hypothetical protein
MRIRLLLTICFTGSILLGQELFDPYQVHTLEIEFYNPDYDQILQDRWEIDDKTYELATVIFNGDTLDSIGVRYKGNSTFWWTQILGSPKFPLNIDFNLIDDDQDLLGYNKVKLSNSIFDATFVKESIGYLTEGYYLPTSEVGYMNVSINDSNLGLYISVESVNKPFLSRHFGNNEGTFFKCEPQFHYGSGLYNAWPDLRWYGADSTAYAYRKGYELKSESSWADLLDLIYTLNFEIDSIETILNVDRALWFFAASQVMPDLDAYNGFYMHNYYLYRNTSSGQFEIIPWDKDHTFGGAMINTIIDLGGNVSWIYNWDPFLFEDDDERPLFSQLIDVPLYKKIYTAHMRTIINDIYDVDHIQSIAYEMQDSIEVYADSYPNIFPSFNSGDYFRYNVDNYLITPDGAHWCGITSTITPRLAYLLNNDEIQKIAPAIGYVLQENMDPEAEEDVIIQAQVTGATTVELMSTVNTSNSQFTSIPMLDDGQHDDWEANDGVYGAIVPFQENGSYVKYYIRASNNDALILSPQKAENEFYEYIVGSLPGSSIVINEINYNSADDEFDPDDWVELYNPTSETISIGLWEFKDENDDHVYTIDEDISLGADEYLVLCTNSSAFADLFPDVGNYVGDIGFGLSGGGELIRLFDSSGVLMDAVEYDDSDPWPEEPDGNGPTLELINPNVDNALAENWAASAGYGSPGSLNSSYLSNEDEVLTSTEFILNNNYPNPFNPVTTISYTLPQAALVRMTVYDLLGRQVKSLLHEYQTPGFKSLQWNATNDLGRPVAAAVYLYMIQAGEFTQTKKMVLLK